MESADSCVASSSASSSCADDLDDEKKRPQDGEIASTSTSPSSSSPEAAVDERHVNVELAALRAELRKARNIAECHEAAVAELRYELEARDEQLLRCQQEKHALVKDARAARDLRDELDCLNHRLAKLDKLESDNARLRERVGELDFYRNKLNQLHAENDLRGEQLAESTAQLEIVKRRAAEADDAERRVALEIDRYRQLFAEVAQKNDRIEALLSENGVLERRVAQLVDRLRTAEQDLDAEEEVEERTPRDGSLLTELVDAQRSAMLEVQLENKKLRAQLAEFQLQHQQQHQQQQQQQQQIPGNDGSSRSSEADSGVHLELEAKAIELEEKERLVLEQRARLEIATRQVEELEGQKEEVGRKAARLVDECDKMRQLLDQACRDADEARGRAERDEQALKESRAAATQAHHAAVAQHEQLLDEKRQLDFQLRELQRKAEDADEERLQTERLAEKLRADLKTARQERDDASEAVEVAERKLTVAERTARAAEVENAALKEKLTSIEDETERLRLRALGTEESARRLEAAEQRLVWAHAELAEARQHDESAQKQLIHEARKAQQLREQLVGARGRLADLVGRLRSLCTAVALNGGRAIEQIAGDDDEQLVEHIDSVVMAALAAAKHEADALRLQQHAQLAELTDLRQDILKLRRAESEQLADADDRVAALSSENAALKQQIFAVQERVRELQLEADGRTAELVAAQRALHELRTLDSVAAAAKQSAGELDRLRTAFQNLQLQEDVLRADNTELRIQLQAAERQRSSAKQDADEMLGLHEALLADHDRLQQLHDSLSTDYERLKEECGALKQRANKANNKMQTNTIEMAEARLQAEERLIESREQAAQRIATLNAEREQLSREVSTLREEIRRLRAVCDVEHRPALDEAARISAQKELDTEKMQHRIDMLSELNATLREESRQLGRQLEVLVAQNRELLTNALADKDAAHEQHRQFQERLADLRRHKEKLEEKIMDQYRAMESKKSREKDTFLRRTARALMSKSPGRLRAQQQHSILVNNNNNNSGTVTSSGTSPSSSSAGEESCSAMTTTAPDDSTLGSPTAQRRRASTELLQHTTIHHSVTTTMHRSRTFVNGGELLATVTPPSSMQIRERGGLFGGSVRVGSGSGGRAPYLPLQNLSFSGSPSSSSSPPQQQQQNNEGALPPRAAPGVLMARNSPLTASLRSTPTSTGSVATGSASTNASTPSRRSSYASMQLPNVRPDSAATTLSEFDIRSPPKATGSSCPSPLASATTARVPLRDQQRAVKASSVYENVARQREQQQQQNSQESDVWYEYGCV